MVPLASQCCQLFRAHLLKFILIHIVAERIIKKLRCFQPVRRKGPVFETEYPVHFISTGYGIVHIHDRRVNKHNDVFAGLNANGAHKARAAAGIFDGFIFGHCEFQRAFYLIDDFDFIHIMVAAHKSQHKLAVVATVSHSLDGLFDRHIQEFDKAFPPKEKLT